MIIKRYLINFPSLLKLTIKKSYHDFFYRKNTLKKKKTTTKELHLETQDQQTTQDKECREKHNLAPPTP